MIPGFSDLIVTKPYIYNFESFFFLFRSWGEVGVGGGVGWGGEGSF